MASRRSLLCRYIVFHRATKSSPSATVRPSLAAMTALVPRTASGELAAMSPASAYAASRTSPAPAPQTRLTRPICAARAGVDVLSRKGELGDVAGADDPGQALERAEIGDDRNLGLAHREGGVADGEAEVARADEVDAAADAVAVHGGDDRERELGDRGHRRPACRARCRRRGRSAGRRVGALAQRDAAELLESRPTLKCGPLAAMTSTRIVSSARDRGGGDGAGRATEGSAQGVTRLGAVQPERRDVTVDLQSDDVGREHPRFPLYEGSAYVARPVERWTAARYTAEASSPMKILR